MLQTRVSSLLLLSSGNVLRNCREGSLRRDEGSAASVQEKQAWLRSNDNEGALVRGQAWLCCCDGARDTAKGCKNQMCARGYLCWHICLAGTGLPCADVLSQRLHPSRHP